MSERLPERPPAAVIVNPRSNLGKTGARMAQLRARLEAALGPHELLLTRAAGHASELASAAIARGAQQLVACGGDGTMSEVLDGLMNSGRASEVTLSLVPLGTGSDFARSLGEQRGLQGERRLDVARVHYRDAAGNQCARHMLNVASVGLSAESVRWIQAQARRGRRTRFSYLFSALVGLRRYEVSDVEISIDGAIVHRGPLCFCAIANGRYFGGGMPVAPHARIDDRLLDVTVVAKLPLWETLPFFARLLRGTHIGHPRTQVGRGVEISLLSAAPVWLEIDGEPVGTLPARVCVQPGALRLRPLSLADASLATTPARR
jgi:diacylglycerol kinase (ATP)